MLRRAAHSGEGSWFSDGKGTLDSGTIAVTAHVQLQPAKALQQCSVVFERPIEIEEGDVLSINGRPVPLVPSQLQGHCKFLPEGGLRFHAGDVKPSVVRKHWKIHRELWGQHWEVHGHRIHDMCVADGALELTVDPSGLGIGEEGGEYTMDTRHVPSLSAFAALLSRLSPIRVPSDFVSNGTTLRANKKLLRRMGFTGASTSKKDVDLKSKGLFDPPPSAVVPMKSVQPCNMDGVCSALSDVLNSHRVSTHILLDGREIECADMDGALRQIPNDKVAHRVDFSGASWIARFAGDYPEREVELSGSRLREVLKSVEAAPFAPDGSFTVDAPDGRLRIRPNSAVRCATHMRVEGPYASDVTGIPAVGLFIGGFLATRCAIDAVPEAPLMSSVSLRIGGYEARSVLTSLPNLGRPTVWSVPLGAVDLEERISVSEIEVSFEQAERVPPQSAVFIEVRQRTKRQDRQATSRRDRRRVARNRSIVNETAEGLVLSDV